MTLKFAAMELERPQPSAYAGLLPSIACPACGDEIEGHSSPARPRRATRFEDCLRRCEKCGVGVSNTGGKQPTFIHRDPLTNVPEEARCGALAVLSHAFNVRSRVSKLRRFGFSTSEDAVAWVVFAYLLRSGQLLTVLKATGLIEGVRADCMPTLLLWGYPLGGQVHEKAIVTQLAALCDRLGEETRSRSEPDVIIDLGASGLLFIEVKYRSGNDRLAADSTKWEKYASAEWLKWRAEEVIASGCYELARNWCLLKGLADTRPATLVNLGPAHLFEEPEGARLARFAQGLDTDEQCRFKAVTWHDLLSGILPCAPEWFQRFCVDDRRLLER